MKILCLIIDSLEPWRETYETHRRVWNAVLDKNPEVEGYFLRSNPSLGSDHFIEGRIFTVRGEERYDTILTKTLKAVEVLFDNHDYVIRTNLSSLYDFPLLLHQELPRLPKENLYAGALGEAYGHTFVSGSGMVLSRDVAQKFLSSLHPVPLSPCDDVAIAQILSARGVRPTHVDRYDYDYGRGEDQVVVGRYVQYRLRDTSDPQRTRERRVAEYLFSKVYPSMMKIDQLYDQARQTWSDIHEHLERMRQLGERCAHITEFGVRTGVSTIAWAAARPKVLVCYDVRRLADVEAVEHAAKEVGVAFTFFEKDVLATTIEPTDLLFIDTLHTYDQLQAELEKHSSFVRNYIVLHDTETFGTVGELAGTRGLWPAVEEFLGVHPEWVLSERRLNNNGLTVLVRQA